MANRKVIARNSDAGPCVENLEEFRNKSNSMYAEWSTRRVYIMPDRWPTGEQRVYTTRVHDWHDPTLLALTFREYTVYSYGEHFPMYTWLDHVGGWFANVDKFSPTTTRHQTLARPDRHITEFLSTKQMQGLVCPKTIIQVAWHKLFAANKGGVSHASIQAAEAA